MIKNLAKLRGVRACVAGIIIKDSKILLTKRSKKIIIEGGNWCLPGGHIKFFEEAEKAIKREIKEEINLNVKKSKFLFFQNEINPKNNLHNLVLIFLLETSGIPKPNWEVSEIKWVDKKEIEKIDLAFNYKEILKIFFSKNF